MLDADTMERHNISMPPAYWNIVRTADTGDNGISPTLRTILDEWNRYKHVIAYAKATRGAMLTDERATYVVDPFRSEGVEDAD